MKIKPSKKFALLIVFLSFYIKNFQISPNKHNKINQNKGNCLNYEFSKYKYAKFEQELTKNLSQRKLNQ